MLFTFVTCDKLAEVPLKSLFLHEDRTLQVLQDVLECLPTVVIQTVIRLFSYKQDT